MEIVFYIKDDNNPSKPWVERLFDNNLIDTHEKQDDATLFVTFAGCEDAIAQIIKAHEKRKIKLSLSIHKSYQTT